jgi:hypothetical protein
MKINLTSHYNKERKQIIKKIMPITFLPENGTDECF